MQKDSCYKPLRILAWGKSASYAQRSGDLIYINPYIINRLESSPFKTQVRKFPIDYGFKRMQEAIVNITIPDSFTVKVLPENKKYIVEASDMQFSRISIAEGNHIQVKYGIEINNQKIEPEYYSELRKAYMTAASAMDDQIVLEHIKKVEVAPAVKAAAEENTDRQTDQKPAVKTKKRLKK